MNFAGNYYQSFATYNRPFINRNEYYLNPVKQSLLTGNHYYGNGNPYYNMYDPYYEPYSYFNQNMNHNINQNTYINNSSQPLQPPQQQYQQQLQLSHLTDNIVPQQEPTNLNINEDPNYTYYGINNNNDNSNNNLYYDNGTDTSYQNLPMPNEVVYSNELLQQQQQQQQNYLNNVDFIPYDNNHGIIPSQPQEQVTQSIHSQTHISGVERLPPPSIHQGRYSRSGSTVLDGSFSRSSSTALKGKGLIRSGTVAFGNSLNGDKSRALSTGFSRLIDSGSSIGSRFSRVDSSAMNDYSRPITTAFNDIERIPEESPIQLSNIVKESGVRLDDPGNVRASYVAFDPELAKNPQLAKMYSGGMIKPQSHAVRFAKAGRPSTTSIKPNTRTVTSRK